MRRREFITLFGTAAVAWPLAARAQQQPMSVVGFLHGGSPGPYARFVAGFHRGLKEAGYVERQNVAIEYRWAEGQYELLPAFAADLVRRQVSVIFATGIPAPPAAKAATANIPIVFVTALDPVEAGLVASLNRPGGNLTGVTSLNVEISPKRLELLHELVPSAKNVVLLVNPGSPSARTQSRDAQAAAQSLGLQLHILEASVARDLETVFEDMTRLRAEGLVIATDPVFNDHIEKLAELSLRHAVPAIYQYREFVMAGGLMSYNGDLADAYRLAGGYVGRILHGAQPADLPVQQVTKVEMFINLKSAKTLSITVPLPLSGRADEVIE